MAAECSSTSSVSWSEGAIVAQSDARQRAGEQGQQGRSGAFKDGPLALAVLMGGSGQRWSAELASGRKECRLLQDRLVSKGISLEEGTGGGASVLGLVVVRQWKCVTNAACSMDTFLMMQGSRVQHPRRQGQRYLEHEIVASAECVSGGDSSGSMSGQCGLAWSAVEGRYLLAMLMEHGGQWVLTSGQGRGSVMAAEEVLGKQVWGQQVGSMVVVYCEAFGCCNGQGCVAW